MDIALGDIILVDLKEEKSEALREVANEIKDDINNIDSLSDETKNSWMSLKEAIPYRIRDCVIRIVMGRFC